MTDTAAGSLDHLRTLALEPLDRAFLHRLAMAGGEQPFSWESVKKAESKALIVQLINLRLVKEVIYSTHALDPGRLYLRLTEDGRAALARCEELEGQLRYAKPPVIEAAPPGGLAALAQEPTK